MYSKTILLDHLRHKGIQNIRIDFPFDAGLNETAKSIPSTWSFTHKCFYLENTPENVQKIFSVFKNKAQVDATRLNARKELFPKTIKQKTIAAQKNFSRLPGETREKVNEFSNYLKSIRYSERTVENYRDMVASFLGFHAPKKIEEITNEDVEKFNYEHILKNHYSVSYQRQVISALKLFYSRVPGRKLKLYELERPQRSYRLPTVLSAEEVMNMLKCIPNLKHKAIIACIYSSGLRISELLNLQIKHIDVQRMQIRVVKGKGDKDRVVGLSKMFLIILKRYAGAYKPVDYLFNGEDGGKYSAESTRNILRNACRKAGIKKKVTPHVLRHSYATHMLENGVDLRYVQELLGHKKPETTMIYTHVTQKKLTSIKSPLDVIMDNLDLEIGDSPALLIEPNKEDNKRQELRLSAENSP